MPVSLSLGAKPLPRICWGHSSEVDNEPEASGHSILTIPAGIGDELEIRLQAQPGGDLGLVEHLDGRFLKSPISAELCPCDARANKVVVTAGNQPSVRNATDKVSPDSPIVRSRSL